MVDKEGKGLRVPHRLSFPISLFLIIIMQKILLILLVFFLLPNIAYARVPNDPYQDQWGFVDTKAYEAWDKATGSRDVVVAIIDSGFDTFHPDFRGNVWKNIDEIPDNGIDDDENNYIDDVWGWDFSPRDFNNDGIYSDSEAAGNNDPRPNVSKRKNITDELHHGTIVAGIIGAVGNNGRDGTGINWAVRMMNLKAVNTDIINEQAPLIEAIYYAVDNGADVINLSLVGSREIKIRDAIKYAYDHGVVVVAAAGNTRVALNISPLDPVCADKDEGVQRVLGVSAIGQDHFLAPFSNTGSSCIDITAPGEDIESTLRYAPRYGLKKSFGGPFQGTSFSAPYVSGAAALIKSIQPTWGAKEIYSAILKNVHRTPPNDVAAYENLYGAGLLQIDKAVEYALAQTASTHPIQSIITVDTKKGRISTQSVNGKSVETRNELAVKSIDYVTASKKGFFTYRQVNAGVGEVVVYNKNWEMKSHFGVPSRGIQSIVSGNVYGNGEDEIILAPTYADTTGFRIYSLSGELLDTYLVKAPHNGVGLGLLDGVKKNEILTLYSQGEGTVLNHLDTNFESVRSIRVPEISGVGSVSAGDIDGDGLQEYIVGSDVGNPPFLMYFNNDGRLLRKFSAYQGDYNGGIPLVVGDFDSDGKDDVITSRNDGLEQVRVWNRRSKKISRWEVNDRVEFILSVYK
jgi:hypothetical protein